jgi:hypothetical protein
MCQPIKTIQAVVLQRFLFLCASASPKTHRWRALRYGSPHYAQIQPFVSLCDAYRLQMVLPFDAKDGIDISSVVLRSFVRSAEKGTFKAQRRVGADTGPLTLCARPRSPAFGEGGVPQGRRWARRTSHVRPLRLFSMKTSGGRCRPEADGWPSHEITVIRQAAIRRAVGQLVLHPSLPGVLSQPLVSPIMF